MKPDEVLRRLEMVALRLERVLDRLEGVKPEPALEEPPPEEMAAAEAFIEAGQWRAEETLRKWERQGGPTDEDAEAYFSSWALWRS